MTDWKAAKAAAYLKAHEAYYAAVEQDGIISMDSTSKAVQAALDTMKAHGYAIVPIDATPKMLEIGRECFLNPYGSSGRVYHAMIKSAQADME